MKGICLARVCTSQLMMRSSPPVTARAEARRGEFSAISSSSHTAAAPARRSCKRVTRVGGEERCAAAG